MAFDIIMMQEGYVRGQSKREVTIERAVDNIDIVCQLAGNALHVGIGVLLEQETLLPGTEATVAIRPALSLNGEPVRVANLKKPHLTVSTRDLDGIDSISEAKDFPLFDDRESTHLFRVPSRLRTVTIELTGEVPSISRPGEETEVRFSRSFEVNGVDAQDVIAQNIVATNGGKPQGQQLQGVNANV